MNNELLTCLASPQVKIPFYLIVIVFPTDCDPRVRDGQLREGGGARLRRRPRAPRAGLPHRQGRNSTENT